MKAPMTMAVSRGLDLSALAALFTLSLRQSVRGRRPLILLALFAMPAALAALATLTSSRPPSVAELQFGLAFNLIPHALAPLAALLYAAGLIRDEVEEQTLTYLLLRPLPKPLLYLVKLVAAYLVTVALTAFGSFLTLGVIRLCASEPLSDTFLDQALPLTGALALAEFAYCALFGLIGLLTRRSLLVGVGYILTLEGLLASLDTVARRGTIMYYYRVLALNWLTPGQGQDWSIDITAAPEVSTCVMVLVGMGVVLSAVGAFLFRIWEFRVKTPEGS